MDAEVLEVELVLERVEAQLASELPAHLRAFARAHATGQAPPAAPDLAGRASTATIGRRALRHPTLAARGAALLRVVAPIVIERDAGVASARHAAASWPGLHALSAARDAVSVARFGRPALAVLHALHGVPLDPVEPPADAELPPRIEAWHAPAAPLPAGAVAQVWSLLAETFGARGALRIEPTDGAHARAFLEEPGQAATIVVPRVIATAAQRFEVLHELGHAVLCLATRRTWPRTLDEAVAAYIARHQEHEGVLPPEWASPDAAAARARRIRIARLLDAIERDVAAWRALPAERPPWALWHDPGAQAAYVAAEPIADALWATLGPVRAGTTLDLAGVLAPHDAGIELGRAI